MNEEKKAPLNTEAKAKENPIDFLAESVIFGPSNAIERQEAQGQKSFVNSDTLPTDGDKGPLEAAGVKFLSVVEDDPIFQYVELPAGWKKQATDHSMHSDLLDEKGRKRAGIFYKAAFYDRHAHFYCNRRFSIRQDYDAKQKQHVSIAHVYDCETIIHSTVPLKHFEGNDRDTLHKNYELADKAVENATKWLAEKYPDWENPKAYWD